MSSKRLFLLVIPSGALILALFFVFTNSSAETTNSFNSSPIKSNSELINTIKQYDLLIFNINHQLRINNYPTILDYSISSDNKIELLITINQEVTKVTTEKITQIVVDTIKQNEFEPDLFRITLLRYNELTEKTNISSTRLSYNDLIGYIGEKLFVKYNISFSLKHEILPEHINITLNLPTNYQTNYTEIRNIILDTIKQHNFDPGLFQIDITNSIN